MHSEKIIKVLGAGLTAAALTLGAAAPALAEVSIKGQDVTENTVNVSGNPTKSEVKATIVYQQSDVNDIRDENVVFTTTGKGYEQKLTLWDEDVASVPNFKVTFDSATGVYGSDLYTGTWKVGDLSVWKVVDPGKDDEALAAVTLGEDIVLNDAGDPVTSNLLDLSTIEYKHDKDFDSYTVSVKVASKYLGQVDKVKFVFTDPAGDKLEWTDDSFLSVAQNKFTFNLAQAYNDLKNDYKKTIGDRLKGNYTLESIVATMVDDNRTYDPMTGYVNGGSLLESSVVADRADNEEAFKKGDMTNVKYAGVIPMLRVYNPNSGEHVYTENTGEVALLQAAGWSYEGIGFYAPRRRNTTTKLVKINRLYDGNDHHYAADGEAALLEQLGWKNEGVAFYSYESAEKGLSEAAPLGWPVYRLYNPNASVGAHHYTTSEGERDLLKSAGWRYEGIGFMAAGIRYEE